METARPQLLTSISLVAFLAIFLALQIVILDKLLQIRNPFSSLTNLVRPNNTPSRSGSYAVINVMDYNNAVFTLTRKGTGDPFMVFAHDKYYLTFTAGKRVVLWRCDHILDFNKRRNLTVVFKPPEGTDHSANLWAPELHALSGRWYIYVSGTPFKGSKQHRQFVLGGPPASQDPASGKWEFLGRIRGMPDVWAIDGSVFHLDNQLYFTYSGRPWNNQTNSPGRQSIFIIKMSDPVTAASQPVMISTPTQPWEMTGKGGTDEGPQFLEDPKGSWRGLVFSCAAARTPQYKMATLKFLGGDPLRPQAWQKSAKPLLRTTKGRPPYGPGHGNFVTTGDEVLAIFHATDTPTDGMSNRRARAQKVIFTDHGPYMGDFVGPLTTDLTVFTRGTQKVDLSVDKRGIQAQFLAPRKGASEVLFDAASEAPEDPDDEDGDERGEEYETHETLDQ